MGLVGRILLIILGILLLLILLIFFVPYGVDAGYEEGVLFLRVKAGPFRFTLYPKKPPSERKKKKQREKQDAAGSEKKAEAAKKKKKKGKKKGEPADTAEQGVDETITVREKTRWDLDTIAALVKMALNALRRFFRAFRVDLLKLHLTVAGSDPYDTALRYGAVCAAAEMLNADDGRCRLRKRDIALGCDFVRTFPEIAFRIVVTVQLYKFVHMAFMFLAEYVIWKIRKRREKKAAALAQREDDNGRQQDE